MAGAQDKVPLDKGVGQTRLLIVDDDIEMCGLLAEYLRSEGFDVVSVHTASDGVTRVLSEHYALVLLDVMMPGMNGFEALRQIRRDSTTPVLMLTARGEDVDRIVGLEIGADDYLPKPFNSRELLARINAILRRTKPDAFYGVPGPDRLTVGDVEMDLGARIVRQTGEPVALTGLEFNLLAVLLKSAGRLVSRERLFKDVLDRRPMPDDRSLDMHISNLRKKLGHRMGTTERIKTVRCEGYIYTLPERAWERPAIPDEDLGDPEICSREEG